MLWESEGRVTPSTNGAHWSHTLRVMLLYWRACNSNVLKIHLLATVPRAVILSTYFFFLLSSLQLYLCTNGTYHLKPDNLSVCIYFCTYWTNVFTLHLNSHASLYHYFVHMHVACVMKLGLFHILFWCTCANTVL